MSPVSRIRTGHATFLELSIAINEYFGTPLTDAEKNRFEYAPRAYAGIKRVRAA